MRHAWLDVRMERCNLYIYVGMNKGLCPPLYVDIPSSLASLHPLSLLCAPASQISVMCYPPARPLAQPLSACPTGPHTGVERYIREDGELVGPPQHFLLQPDERAIAFSIQQRHVDVKDTSPAYDGEHRFGCR
jgi:hypothetical protein